MASSSALKVKSNLEFHWYLMVEMVEISANFSYVDFFPSKGFWVSKQASSICLWTCRAGVMRLLPVQMFAEKQKKKDKKKIYFLPASITKNWKSFGCGGNKTSVDVTRPLIYSSYSSGQPQFCVELKDKRSHMYIKLFVALDKDSPLWNTCLK